MNAAGLCGRIIDARALALGLIFCVPLAALAAPWSQYRGSDHNGISTDRIVKQWTGSVTNPVWRVALTNGLGSVVVDDRRVFTLARRLVAGQDKEICVALNITNGVEQWATTVDDADYPHGGVGFDDGPRSTPAVDGGSVYVLSSYLKLLRLNATNGSVIWSNDLVSLYGSEVIPWQNAASPVIENGLIFLNANTNLANPMRTLFALRTSDGGVAWRSQVEQMTHASPTIATIHGTRQVIFCTQDGLVSLAPDSGNLLWRTNFPFQYGTSIAVSPVVWNDLIFTGGAHAYVMGSIVVRASFSNDVWSVVRVWYTNNPATHWMTPVVRDGFLYGPFGIQFFDSVNAQLKCVDMRTGAVKWSVDNFGRGATLLVDDHLVTITERGQLVLARPTTNAYTELGRFTAITGYHDFTNKCWNAPAVADGRIFVRSTSFVACFDLSIPALKLDAPQFSPGGVDLSIRTVTGAPVASNRLSGMEVRATGNPELAVAQWSKLTNSLVLTGGVVRVTNAASATATQRFFIVSEPQ